MTRIEPLANGTFAEVGERKAAGLKTKSKLRGTVTWIDPMARLAVVSSRGSSLAVDLEVVAEGEIAGLVTGSSVDSVVTLGEPVAGEEGAATRPGLVVESLESTGDALEGFDLNGQVTIPEGTARELEVSADGAGLIPAVITVRTPRDFDPELVTDGETYNLSVERGADGELSLTGLSADHSVKAAGDAAGAYGTHA